MRCLVLVRFLPGGSLPPDEFFARLQAKWMWLERGRGLGSLSMPGRDSEVLSQPRAAVGIADYDSVEQLSIDISIMPGAGISNVEVVPIEETRVSGQFHQVSALSTWEGLI